MMMAKWNCWKDCGIDLANWGMNTMRCRTSQEMDDIANTTLCIGTWIPYLGLGSSAASFLQSDSHSWHYCQKEDLHAFAEGTLFGGYEIEKLGSDQLIEEYLMMALRTNRGIEKNLFKARFSLDFDLLFSKTIANLDPLWYKDTNYIFILSKVGWLVLDEIILRLALQIPQPLDRH